MKLFTGKATKTALITAALAITPTVAFAAGENLASDYFVGISFWLISMALVASTSIPDTLLIPIGLMLAIHVVSFVASLYWTHKSHLQAEVNSIVWILFIVLSAIVSFAENLDPALTVFLVVHGVIIFIMRRLESKI